MDFIAELTWRGLIQDLAGEEEIKKLGPKYSFYNGLDPTAPSLQLGNLIGLIVTKHISMSGAKPIILFGGATGAIGDPSGKSEERKLLSIKELQNNVANQQQQVNLITERIGVKVEFVDNADWIQPISFINFLRDTGKHFTINYMLAKETVKTRLSGSGISFTEFSYMLIQAYDFYHLYKTKNCLMQMGGSDQWGNITAGLELIRKSGVGSATALSWPLLTDSSGKKLGKSEDSALWLDAKLTSAFKFHQFFMNLSDLDAIKCLKIFTLLSKSEIAEYEKLAQSEPEKRATQKRLADEICNLVHGKEATSKANKSAEVLFGGSLDGLSDTDLLEIFSEVPSSEVPSTLVKDLTIEELVYNTKVLKSKSEIKRLVASGGLYLNNLRVEDGSKKLMETNALSRKVIVIRTGKKSYHLAKLA